MPTARIAAADMADSDVADFLFAAVGGERTRLLGVLRHYRNTEAIALTRNEIRHLFTALVLTPVRAVTHWMRWSRWRHQYRARHSHYQ
ncbi:hypothetical protein [Nocardia abscessus]|uniref:hypothetical protein n=1 Tax=Nocardia abscessus TaxID=120957 RepID=UPI0024573937|nr:hypothetical protein [Nocardia abscessus]